MRKLLLLFFILTLTGASTLLEKPRLQNLKTEIFRSQPLAKSTGPEIFFLRNF